jgi:hypothetical protein
MGEHALIARFVLARATRSTPSAGAIVNNNEITTARRLDDRRNTA